ncbi:MAG: heme biosynthesis HemY N-terminal domain-containing protein [Lysobacteraceae bacterium]
MRLLWKLLILLALAIAGALLWQKLAADPGYLQLVWGGWSLETTLPVAIAAALIALALLIGLVWLIRLPFKGWKQARERRARRYMADGLLAVHRGEWRRAEQNFAAAARDPQLAVAAQLNAEEAARRGGRLSEARAWLDAARDSGGEGDVRLLEAQRRLDDGLPETALERFESDGERPRGPRALHLQLQALNAAGRAGESLGQLGALRKACVLGDDAQSRFETETAAAALHQAADVEQLIARWRSLGRAQRRQSAVTDAFVSRALALKEGRRAARAIEDSVKREWDDALAARYGELDDSEPRQRIKRLETWLEQHPDSPSLQLALGRLCRREELWGKSQDYLTRALKNGAGAPAWEAKAELHADRDNLPRARLCYLNALRLHRGEKAVPLPEEPRQRAISSEEPTESRDANGMPRLGS